MAQVPIRSLLAFAALAAAYSTPSATTAQPANFNDRTEILFLGTAGGPPLRRDRSEPATLIIVDGRTYLIDCGIGTVQRILQVDIDPPQIMTIFLTHLHSDHDLGLADLMGDDFFLLNLRGASRSIGIYGPPQTKELVDAAFHFIGVAARPFAVENPASYRMRRGHFVDPFEVHEFDRSGLIYEDDKIRVTAAENSHYALMTAQERNRFKSYAFRIQTPHGTVVFTGDTGPSDAVVRLAEGADVLIAEADALNAAGRERFINMMAARNHWTAKREDGFRAHFISEHLDTGEIGHLASDAHIKSVVLYHYDPADKVDQAAYVRGVRQTFGGTVFAPDDLDRYCLSAGILSRCPAAASETK